MVLNGWTSLKNGATALRAFSRARRTDPQLKLTCFGAGFEHAGPAHVWAQRHGFDVNVSFRGPVPHRAIIEQMCNSTALLHPSRWEACCMSIAEAMSVGLPVIAGRKTDGVPWQLDNGAAGALVDVTDPEDTAASIVRMASDAVQWERWSVAARARARRLFSSDAVVDRYVDLYAGVQSAGTETAAALNATP
jgi:glycosyltransferase involved in cell wall biosynthesis